jgi:hypothetical protein
VSDPLASEPPASEPPPGEPPPAPDDPRFHEWAAAELRRRGLDPEQLSVDEIIALMGDALDTLLTNLSSAYAAAPDEASQADMTALLEQAEQLRGELQQLMGQIEEITEAQGQAAAELPAAESAAEDAPAERSAAEGTPAEGTPADTPEG